MDEISMLPGYFDSAFTRQDAMVRAARRVLAHIDFDTMVGTGLSGALAIPVLARSLRKKFLIVRKEDDNSTHSEHPAEGVLGRRWVFVDDFMSSGRTFQRVVSTVDRIARSRGSFCTCSLCEDQTSFRTDHVGMYEYTRREFSTPDVIAVRLADRLSNRARAMRVLSLPDPLAAVFTPEAA